MIRLRLYTKNWSLLSAEDYKTETEHVPRTGEVIDATQLLGMPPEEVSTFIVIEVIHEYEDGRLVPLVVAHQQILEDHGNADARVMALRENGWLPASD